MPTSDYTPALADVGALLTTRTRDSNGAEQGTFTSDTRPTDAQVNVLIGKAVERIENKLGADIDSQLFEPAKDVAALDVAMRIELSYFADQIQAQRSPYTELKALHDQQLADLIDAAERIGAAEGEIDPLAASPLPSYSFPPLGPTFGPGGSESPNDPYGMWWS